MTEDGLLDFWGTYDEYLKRTRCRSVQRPAAGRSKKAVNNASLFKLKNAVAMKEDEIIVNHLLFKVALTIFVILSIFCVPFFWNGYDPTVISKSYDPNDVSPEAPAVGVVLLVIAAFFSVMLWLVVKEARREIARLEVSIELETARSRGEVWPPQLSGS